MPCETDSSRKNSPSTRLPNKRPCMSVKQVTTVSIVPSSTSLRSSSRLSMPRTASAVVAPITSVISVLALRARWRCRACFGGLRRHGHLVDRAHGAGVLLPCIDDPPDADKQADDEHERRVVQRAPFPTAVPGNAGGREWNVERVQNEQHEENCAHVDPFVVAAQRPRTGLERVALPEPQEDGDDVREIEPDGADRGDREVRPWNAVGAPVPRHHNNQSRE